MVSNWGFADHGVPRRYRSCNCIVANSFNLFEVCLQNLDISLDEGAVIFFLTKIALCVISCSHFTWSFHGGCPSFLVFVRGMRDRGDRLKSVLLFKIENLVLKEARPCGAYKEQILS